MIRSSLIFLMVFAILFPGLNKACGQYFEMKKQLSADEKKQLLDISKELFKIEPSFEYSISQDEVLPSFSKIKIETPPNIEELQKSLSKDSLNPITLFFMGNYYSDKGNITLANSFFQKAYDHLKEDYFKNDSSKLYAIRGILKSFMKHEDAGSDFEKSLEINPNDSLALAFYPLALMANGKLSEARNLCVNLLDRKIISPILPYVYLITIEEMSALQFVDHQVRGNLDKKLEYRKKDFTQFLDYRLLDKYSESSGDSIEMKNAKVMAEILGLINKIMVFESDQLRGPVLEYTQGDLKKLGELKEWLLEASDRTQMNEYALNKNLGYVHYMLKDSEKAIGYFTKAVDLFPLSKKCDSFNPSESFQALLSLYYYKNDTTNYRRILERKISIEPTGKKSVLDYRNLATYYFSIGQLEKAKEWGLRARIIDPNDFETPRLLAHLYFLNGLDFMTQFYFDDLVKLINYPLQGYEYLMQLAIYQLYNDNARGAFENIELGRKAFLESFPGNSTCKLCDTLIANYIQESN